MQGVYFRASTAEHAIALSLCGSAENLADGGVLVLAAGKADALAKLIAWLRLKSRTSILRRSCGRRVSGRSSGLSGANANSTG